MKHINVALFVPHLGCPNNCIFCNQKTISGKCEELKAQEIISSVETAKKTPHDVHNSEIAFFGGSFTAIEREKMLQYLETASAFVGDDFGGIRISTRPDAIDEEILEILKKYSVTSIELGAQSMCDDVLLLNERGHCAEDTRRAARLIKEHGFSLGLQMMTGLYGSSREKDMYTARQFVELKPDTVRIYPTVVLEGTRLAEYYENGMYTPETLEESVEKCSILLELFHKNSIRVIRLGLHSGGNVEEGFIAGVYHPAFRELCEAGIYKNLVSAELNEMPKGSYTVSVNPRVISKMTGQKKSNIEYFGEKGYSLKIKGDETLTGYQIKITK